MGEIALLFIVSLAMLVFRPPFAASCHVSESVESTGDGADGRQKKAILHSQRPV